MGRQYDRIDISTKSRLATVHLASSRSVTRTVVVVRVVEGVEELVLPTHC